MKNLFPFLLLVLFGCAARVQLMPHIDLTYPRTTGVDVFRTLAPQRDYVEFAELWINSNQPDAAATAPSEFTSAKLPITPSDAPGP